MQQKVLRGSLRGAARGRARAALRPSRGDSHTQFTGIASFVVCRVLHAASESLWRHSSIMNSTSAQGPAAALSGMEVVALSAAAAAASALACFAASASRDAPPTTTVPQVRPFSLFCTLSPTAAIGK